MEERRIKLRRHIQAARAWLLQADKSLERNNDVQGDLKLMLAKAELAQTRTSYRSLIKKILPPLTALMIAGAFFMDGEPPAPEAIPISPPPSIETVEQTPPIQPDAVVEIPAIEESIVEPIIEPIIEPIVPIEEPIFEQASEPIEEVYPEENYSATYEPIVEEYNEPEYYDPPAVRPIEETYVPEAAAVVPDEDMQRLMLDAGQILRAK